MERKKRAGDYLKTMYSLRYFIFHLVKLDLQNKFRRSKLGLMWTFISPLCLTMIMAVVFSAAFHSDILTYAPYILSGMLFWDIFNGSFQQGGSVIIANQFYIRQCNNPYSLYTLKTTLVIIISFLIASVSLLCWLIFINPMGILLGLLMLIPATLIYFVISWSATTIGAYTCVKYRDYPMLVPLVTQILWYISPVFFREEMFESNKYLYIWFCYNPITSLLNLIRKPFLYTALPSGQDYLISVIFAVVMALWAYRVSSKNGKEVIFYL